MIDWINNILAISNHYCSLVFMIINPFSRFVNQAIEIYSCPIKLDNLFWVVRNYVTSMKYIQYLTYLPYKSINFLLPVGACTLVLRFLAVIPQRWIIQHMHVIWQIEKETLLTMTSWQQAQLQKGNHYMLLRNATLWS